MRVGDFIVELVLESGHILPEVTNGGVTYAIASPGERFSVRVASLRPKVTYKVYLRVDGIAAGFSKVLKPTRQHCTFEGILMNAVGEDCKYKLFQFKDSIPTTSELPAAQPTTLDRITLGRVEMKAVQVKGTGARRVPAYRVQNQHTGPPGVKLPDGKKWFLAPSLSACNGPSAAKKTNWNTVVWKAVGEPVKATLRYETASTLVLRGILDESDPVHRALIQQSLQQEAARVAAAVAVAVKPEPGEGQDQPSSSRAASTSRASAQARTRGGQDAGGSGSRRPPMLDLSIEQDDNVLCDLTGNSPTWHWSKKPRIEID